MTDSRRHSFGSTTGSAWGQTHLAMDAVVAFVDEELSPGARRRALSHLACCGECASEVVAQTQARLALRAAAIPTLPSSLLHSLRAIPSQAELPAPPAGLAVGPDGELVSLLRPAPVARLARERRPIDRRVRVGAGAVVSGLALGALMVAGSPTPGPVAAGPGLPGPSLDARLQFGGRVRDAADTNPWSGVGARVPASSVASVGPAATPRVVRHLYR